MKVVLIDLEDTITIHTYNNRIEGLILEWLRFNGVKNAESIYNNEKYKNRNERLELLGIKLEEYKKWYSNFNIVEFEFYKEKFLKNLITIPESTLEFIKKTELPLILVSNSSPLWIDYILNKYNIKNNFKYIFKRDYSFDDIKKPNKEVLDIIENDLKIKIDKDSIMIGDSQTDIDFANNCGFTFKLLDL